MLKGIDPLLTGDALKALQDMGHGDTLALVDSNYPAHSSGRPVIHLGEVSAERAARAILSVFPLDTFIDQPLARMLADNNDPAHDVHDAVRQVAEKEWGSPLVYNLVARPDFYTQAQRCSVIFHTLEDAPYSCFFMTKGVV
jgi:L-fucose mutarotase